MRGRLPVDVRVGLFLNISVPWNVGNSLQFQWKDARPCEKDGGQQIFIGLSEVGHRASTEAASLRNSTLSAISCQRNTQFLNAQVFHSIAQRQMTEQQRHDTEPISHCSGSPILPGIPIITATYERFNTFPPFGF